MIALLLSIMCGIILCVEKQDVKIAHYHPHHFEAAYALIVKNQEQLIPLYQELKNNKITEEKYQQDALDEVLAFLNDEGQPKRVLLTDQRVIGFAGFCKYKEHSIEGLLTYYHSRNITMTERQLLEICPSMKRKQSECQAYALIKGLIIDEPFRGKGLGKLLFADLMKVIALSTTFISYAYLDVHAENLSAHHIYKLEGFKLNEHQHSDKQWLRYKKIFSNTLNFSKS